MDAARRLRRPNDPLIKEPLVPRDLAEVRDDDGSGVETAGRAVTKRIKNQWIHERSSGSLERRPSRGVPQNEIFTPRSLSWVCKGVTPPPPPEGMGLELG